MSYIKACDVLPSEVIELIQEYIDGKYLYIPRKKGNEKTWGELSGAKRDLGIRNRIIFRTYCSGISVSVLAADYFLSEQTIRKIISIQKHQK